MAKCYQPKNDKSKCQICADTYLSCEARNNDECSKRDLSNCESDNKCAKFTLDNGKETCQDKYYQDCASIYLQSMEFACENGTVPKGETGVCSKFDVHGKCIKWSDTFKTNDVNGYCKKLEQLCTYVPPPPPPSKSSNRVLYIILFSILGLIALSFLLYFFLRK